MIQSRSIALLIGLAVPVFSGCSGLQQKWHALRDQGRIEEGSAFGKLPSMPSKSLNSKEKADLQFAVASSLENKGDLDGAVSAYEQTLRLDEEHAQARHRLAVLLTKTGEFDEATEHFEKATALTADDARLLCDFGYSLYLQGRIEEAERVLLQSRRIDRQAQRTHNNLALIFAATGRHDAALQAFTNGGASLAQAHNNVAFVLLESGDLRGAEAYFQKVAGLQKTDDESREKAAHGRTLIAKLQGQQFGRDFMASVPHATALQ